jgi:nascent polypeptide-associated complex subunit alpha
MNPREMQKAMKRLGIKQDEIEADLVIIKRKGLDIVIRNPQVMKVNMMGQESLQISGEMEEVEQDTKAEINDDDIQTVIDQTGCSKEEAVSALEESNSDIAEAIMKLQK